jgi:hypothetical protein
MLVSERPKLAFWFLSGHIKKLILNYKTNPKAGRRGIEVRHKTHD